jgi:hypothetical protein
VVWWYHLHLPRRRLELWVVRSNPARVYDGCSLNIKKRTKLIHNNDFSANTFLTAAHCVFQDKQVKQRWVTQRWVTQRWVTQRWVTQINSSRRVTSTDGDADLRNLYRTFIVYQLLQIITIVTINYSYYIALLQLKWNYKP